MKAYQLFGYTQRNPPIDSAHLSFQLLVKGGYFRPVGSGNFISLSLGNRVFRKLENLIRNEFETEGGQEISITNITGNDPVMFHIGKSIHEINDDVSDNNSFLIQDQEKFQTDLIIKEIRSTKELPRVVFQFSKKLRDTYFKSDGFFGNREFFQFECFYIHQESDGEENSFVDYKSRLENIFARCGIPTQLTETRNKIAGCGYDLRYFFINKNGDRNLLSCTECDYLEKQENASIKKPLQIDEDPLEVKKVYTPGAHTIDSLVNFLDIPREKTAKAVFLVAIFQKEVSVEERFIFAIIRGDNELNPIKLQKVLNAKSLRSAREDEIYANGAVPGYGSPVGLKNTFVIVDELIPISPNLVGGANEIDFHYININYGRDFKADMIADITLVKEGDLCPRCGGFLMGKRGYEICSISSIAQYPDPTLRSKGYNESNSSNLSIQKAKMDISRLIACIVEENHDEIGIIWPVAVSPFQVHIIFLKGKGNNKSELIAEELYKSLKTSGIDVLLDDGDDSPGVKFNNADLIGSPVRITISERSIELGGVEVKLRNQQNKQIISKNKIIEYILAELENLRINSNPIIL